MPKTHGGYEIQFVGSSWMMTDCGWQIGYATSYPIIGNENPEAFIYLKNINCQWEKKGWLLKPQAWTNSSMPNLWEWSEVHAFIRACRQGGWYNRMHEVCMECSMAVIKELGLERLLRVYHAIK